MLADLGTFAPEADDEMQSRVDSRECCHPHMLEDSQHREFSILIYQRVIAHDGEVANERVRKLLGAAASETES